MEIVNYSTEIAHINWIFFESPYIEDSKDLNIKAILTPQLGLRDWKKLKSCFVFCDDASFSDSFGGRKNRYKPTIPT